MSIRNDCRVELGYRIHALGGAREVILDLCFTVGDSISIRPRFQGLPSSMRYSAMPHGPVLFLGMLLDPGPFVRHVAFQGIGDPPFPFYSPELGVVQLPMSALDEVICGSAVPLRSHWRFDVQQNVSPSE